MIDTKQHILLTSLKLFLQKSYRDVTMKELVIKTGLSKGAFYHYFNSKEELFKEIVNQFFSLGSTEYSKLKSKTFKDFYTDYANYTIKTFTELLKLVGDNPEEDNTFNFFYIMFEAIKRFPEFLELEKEMHNNDIKEWAKIIQKAKNNNEIVSSSSNEQIAEIYLCCADGIAIRMAALKKGDYLTKELLKTFDCLYEGLKKD